MTTLSLRTLVGALAVLTLTTLSAAAMPAPGSSGEGSRRAKSMTVEVDHARILFLSSTVADPGADLTAGTADDDTAGPLFVVVGDVVRVDGRPVTGRFVCRGVVFTAAAPPQTYGIAQVNVTFDIDGRGILFCQSLEFKSSSPAGAVIGGTGEFERMSGTYTPQGAPSPLGDGHFTFTFSLRRNK